MMKLAHFQAGYRSTTNQYNFRPFSAPVDKYMFEDMVDAAQRGTDKSNKPSGAARGQSGSGGKLGSMSGTSVF